MDRLLLAAEAALRHHAAPALRLTELLRQVRLRLGAITPDTEGLRRALQSRPDRFRVLDPWRGPWRHVARDPALAPAGDPWVVVVGDPGDDGADCYAGTSDDLSRTQERLRASVRWLGTRLDGGTSRAVARFHVIAVAAERTTPHLSARPDGTGRADVKKAA